MIVEWKLLGNKEEIKPALEEWMEEFRKAIIDLAGKSIQTPLGPIPVPIFDMDYEEMEKGFLIKITLPIPNSRILKVLIFPNLRSGKKKLKEYFESRGIKVEIK